eukprot:15482951-Alexandrium_andersonii.AAC.1
MHPHAHAGRRKSHACPRCSSRQGAAPRSCVCHCTLRECAHSQGEFAGAQAREDELDHPHVSMIVQRH